LAGVRADGRFDIAVGQLKITENWKNFNLLQPGDGYTYA